MWIEAEGPHKRFVNTSSFDTFYVSYRGGGHWDLCATIGTNDIRLKSFAAESLANMELSILLTKIRNE